jgi:hypothetical protein
MKQPMMTCIQNVQIESSTSSDPDSDENTATTRANPTPIVIHDETYYDAGELTGKKGKKKTSYIPIGIWIYDNSLHTPIPALLLSSMS